MVDARCDDKRGVMLLDQSKAKIGIGDGSRYCQHQPAQPPRRTDPIMSISGLTEPRATGPHTISNSLPSDKTPHAMS